MARGVWRLWADVPEPARGQLRGLYRELRTKYRPHGRLGRAAAVLATETAFTALAAFEAGVVAVVKRGTGRGRRPNARQVNALLKRSALQLGTLDRLLPGGVADLLAGERNRNGDPLAAVRRAVDEANL